MSLRDKKEVINKVQAYIKKKFEGESSGHDWYHICRVWKMSKEIAKKEGGDLFVIELSALLHDVADWKFNGGDLKEGSKVARKFLGKFKIDEQTVQHICDTIDNISFKGSGAKNEVNTIEGKIVQDADRLDALGAIGIARAFAYSGHKGKAIYNPTKKKERYNSFKDYKNRQGHGINHFYEKLLTLKDLMNTKTAKKMAKVRHKFMELYLEEFFKEWKGNL